MTNFEIWEAFQSGNKVKSNNLIYDYISGIIYRKINNKLKISAELYDGSGHSVTIAEAKRVSLVREDEIHD